MLSLDKSSCLDATATGKTVGPGSVDNDGGSYGGQGASKEDDREPSTYGTYYTVINEQDYSNLDNFLGSGGAKNGDTEDIQTKGGGAIVLRSKLFQIYGFIDASGGPNNIDLDGYVAGGSGGYICIVQLQGDTSNATNIFQEIKANGGNGFGDNGVGGSGGRIIMNFMNATDDEKTVMDSDLAQALGGKLVQSKYDKNFNGAPGTIYFKYSDILVIKGDKDAKDPRAKTPVASLPDPITKVIVSQTAILSLVYDPEKTSFSAVNISLQNGGQIKGPVTTEVVFYMEIKCVNLELLESSKILSSRIEDKVYLECDNIYIDGTSTFDFSRTDNTEIYAKNNFTTEAETKINTGQEFYLHGANMSFGSIILANSGSNNTYGKIIAYSHLESKGLIKCDYMTMYANDTMKVKGNMSPSNDKLRTCSDANKQSVQSFVDPTLNAFQFDQVLLSEEALLKNVMNYNNLDQLNLDDMASLFYQNFTVTLIAINELHISTGVEILGPRIAIYADKILHKGSLNSSYWGCEPGQGPGAGIPATDDCGGTGAAHAGNGGISSRRNSKSDGDVCINSFKISTLSRSYGQYNDMSVYEGSGGGPGIGLNKGSRGGGFIWIQSSSLELNKGSKISSNGMDIDDLQAGGGSGGTIAISTYRLYGVGSLQARGGCASKNMYESTGGGGSGGRIKILRFGWQDIQFFENDGVETDVGQNDFQLVTHGGSSLLGDSRKASVWSTPCPPGYAGPLCSSCPAGFYSNDIFNSYCSQCLNMPEGALGTYKSSGWNNTSCPYTCNEGITPVSSNKMCLNTFNLFLNDIGGMVIFVIMIVSALLVVISVIYFLSDGNKSKSIDKLIEQKSRELDESNADKKGDRDLKILHHGFKFFDRDVFQHFCRIYFLGSNNATHPWKLPITPPVVLRPRIILERYVEFANTMNQVQLSSTFEQFGLRFLYLCYPALVPRYIYWARKKNCAKFLTMLKEQMETQSIWKYEEDRMRNHTHFKFSFSDRISLGYIDFLDTRLTTDSYEGPQFPQTLFLSGEGVYYNPYNLDFENDPIIKSIGLKTQNHKIWKKFVKNLNSKLWSISPFSFNWYLRRQIFNTLNFINKANHQIFKYYGFKISLWIVELTYHQQEDFERMNNISESFYKLDSSYIKKKPEAFTNFLNYWKSESLFNYKMKEFKLALVLQDINQKTEMEADESVEKTQRAVQKSQPFNRRSSQEQFTIGVTKMEFQNDAHLRNLEDHLSDNTGSPKKSPNMNSRPRSSSSNEVFDGIQWITTNIREAQIEHSWLKQFKKPINQGLSCCDQFLDMPKQVYLFLAATVQFTAFRNGVNNSNIIASVIPYTLLVIMDCVFTYAILKQLHQHDVNYIFSSVGGWLFVLCYPFASIISPIFGVISMISCKTKMFQNQAYFNALSLFTNTITLIIASLFASREDNHYLLIFSFLLMLTKIGLAQMLPLQISFFNNPKYSENKQFLWKNNTAGKDSDDETYFSDQDSNDNFDKSSPTNHFEAAKQFSDQNQIEGDSDSIDLSKFNKNQPFIAPKQETKTKKKSFGNALKDKFRGKSNLITSNKGEVPQERGYSEEEKDQDLTQRFIDSNALIPPDYRRSTSFVDQPYRERHDMFRY